jgi:hypothetical protein
MSPCRTRYPLRPSAMASSLPQSRAPMAGTPDRVGLEVNQPEALEVLAVVE